jgi:predicted Zn-dependent protease
MTPDETAERALELSRSDGAIVLVEESDHVDLRWAGNTLTTNGAARDRRVTVIAFSGGATGIRSATAPDLAALEDLVRGAEQAAAEADPADDAAPLIGGGADESFTEQAQHTSASVFDVFASDLGEAFREARGTDRLLYGFAQHDVTTTWLASSTGLRLRYVDPVGSVDWTAKSGRPGGSVWAGQSTRDFTDVDVPATVADLRRKLSWTDRQIELPAGRYETLMPATGVADLMVYLCWSAAGRDADEGRTVFSRAGGGTRLGESLGPAGLSLTSDPTSPGLECLPFVVAHSSGSTSSVFDNGLPLDHTSWLEDGALSALVETRASARRSGRKVTPAIDNLTLEGAGQGATLEDMVSRTKRGLLLTSLWYIREVDLETLLLTGLTRDGVFLVEDGEVVGAVNNYRFNESPVDLLGRMAEIGVSEPCLPREWADWFTRARMPAVRFPDFNMSSVSPAS